MAVFMVDVVGGWLTALSCLWEDYGEPDDLDCIEDACAHAGIYCDWISRRIAKADPAELARWSTVAVEVRVGQRKRLRARWELRAPGNWYRVTP